jgi:hypothetical protein
MVENENHGGTPYDNRDTATDWQELPRPNSYQEAVAVASRLISARLNTDPKERWRIRVDRTELGPPKIFLKTDLEGRTRAEFFNQLAAGNDALTVADRAMLKRLNCEQLARTTVGKGRPSRGQAALKHPAGQSLDAIIFETCLMLKGLGWTPLARASETGLRTSTFDAVAEALSANQPRRVAYSGIRDAYYRVSE